MVCERCEQKLQKVACPDVWKEGATNTLESGGRKINENKLLSATGPRRPVEPTIRSIGDAPPGPSRKTAAEKFNPYARRCKICKGSIAQQGAYYCQTCAYQKGICSMCGKKVLDTTSYRQSTV